MNKEIFNNEDKIEIEKINRIPLKERMAFQVFLVRYMLGERSLEKTKKEWNEEEIKWAEMYAKVVSDIIDNPENKEIRNLIMEEKYKEASDIMIEMLKNNRIDVIV